MAPAPERLTSALADRYAIEREIGRGGMATVYLALDRKHRRQVAIKVLRPELAATLGVDRFVREIEIAARLTHPHILPLFDSGEAGGFLYYVMPYVAGESLRDRLDREGRLAPEAAIRIAAQVASALSHAHRQGIIHRDIKPENILLLGDQALLADFGVARAVAAAGEDRLTLTGLVLGTPVYMSPEQALGAATIGPASDLYALGCVLFEMLGGQAPFQGATPQAVIAQHAARPVPSLRQADPSLPPFLERVVQTALAKDPADRFPDADALAAVLTTGTLVPGPRRRPRFRRLVTAGALLLLAGVVLWNLGSRALGGEIGRVAVLPLTDLSAPADQEYLVQGVQEAMISELARLGIPVIARTSMMHYRNTTKSLREIARELEVDAIIEGSVFRAGDSLEIAARMYDGCNERELWSGAYDGTIPDVVALYRGFARAIADRIDWALSPEAEGRLGREAPVNPAVYEAYLRGMYHLNQSTPEDFGRALGYFEQAVKANPADPLVYAGLAFAYITLGHGPAPPPDAWPRARAAAERAVRLDSTLAEGWAALADIRTYYEWDWAGAEQAFQRANALNPALPMNHYHHAWYLALFDRADEAIAEHEEARRLDPLTPLHSVWLPGLHLYLGRTGVALRLARQTARQYPDNAVAQVVLGIAEGEAGHFPEAIAAQERARQLNPAWTAALARTYILAGRVEDGRRLLADLLAQPPTAWGALGLAGIYAALGDRDAAFRWLDHEPHHAWLPWSRLDPALRELRGDPRFAALLERMRLPG